MSVDTFTALAHWLLEEFIAHDGGIEHGNDDLFGAAEGDSPLFAASDELRIGNPLGALDRLGALIAAAAKPVEPPASGRKRLERHLASIHQRATVLKTAQIARVLVLDGLKSAAASTTTTEQTGA